MSKIKTNNMATIFSKNLSVKQVNLNKKIFNLALNRMLKTIYLKLDSDGKKEMEQVFLSDNDDIKEKFIQKNIPNFEDIFQEELKKINQEILKRVSN